MDYQTHRMHAAQNLLALDYGIRNNYSVEQLMAVSERVIDHVVGCTETKTPARVGKLRAPAEPLEVTDPDSLRAALARYEAALQANAGRDRVAALLRAASAMGRAIKKELAQDGAGGQ